MGQEHAVHGPAMSAPHQTANDRRAEIAFINQRQVVAMVHGVDLDRHANLSQIRGTPGNMGGLLGLR